jgi:hypothetical protein
MGDVGTKAVVSFHRSLYLPDAVRDAVSSYEDYTEGIDVEEGPEDVIVTLRGWDPGYGDAFVDHFSNHVLFQSIVLTRQKLGGLA